MFHVEDGKYTLVEYRTREVKVLAPYSTEPSVCGKYTLRWMFKLAWDGVVTFDRMGRGQGKARSWALLRTGQSVEACATQHERDLEFHASALSNRKRSPKPPPKGQGHLF